MFPLYSVNLFGLLEPIPGLMSISLIVDPVGGGVVALEQPASTESTRKPTIRAVAFLQCACIRFLPIEL